MRIISGSARGRKLAEFKGSGIRPTPDRAREALFSILTSRSGSLNGARVLELFAGSGALSLEALSRGADRALLVDSSPQAIALIRENIARCRMEAQTEVLRQPADKALSQLDNRSPFDLIFMDPPYNKGHIPRILGSIATLQLLAQNGIIAAESATGEQIDLPEGLRLIESRRYGSSEIHLIERDTALD